MASFLSILLCYSMFFVCLAYTSAVLRPRGVPLSRKIFYHPGKKFTCMDGSAEIPFNFINDDYCDCEDGSDEPGTAACVDGEFICCNYGYLSVVLPSSRVNDGICDCCDASDEFNSTADCLDTCKELGQESLNDAKSVYQQYRTGNDTRHIYIFEAVEKKEQYKIQLSQLREKEAELLHMKLYKQELKEKAEERENTVLEIQKKAREEQERERIRNRLMSKQELDKMEAEKAFKILDLNEDEKVSLDEVLLYPKFDYDGDGKVSDTEAQFYTFKREELTMDEFYPMAWNMMRPVFVDEDKEDPGGSVSKPYHEDSAPKSHKPAPAIDEAEKQEIIANAANRRKEFADANKSLQDIQDEIWNVEKKISMDYGPDDAFLALENKCFEYTEKRYLYKLCLFDKAVQMARHNSDEILLGLWENWCGPDKDSYSQMCYTRGSSCWNGPMRSIVVNLKCGLENKLISVVETNPCVYMFEFETPASCKTVPLHVEQIMNNHVISL